MFAAAISFLALVCLWPDASGAHATAPQSSAASRVADLRAKVAKKPRLWPAQAALAQACLVEARATLDPAAVACARNAALASLDVQLNVEAFLALAGIQAFSHRFEACVDAASKAESGRPGDGIALSLRVDCLLALGRRDEAGALVETAKAGPRGEGPPSSLDFYLPIAEASLAKADGRIDAAVERYRAAAATAARAVSMPASPATSTSAAGASSTPAIIEGGRNEPKPEKSPAPKKPDPEHAHGHTLPPIRHEPLPADDANELRIWALVEAVSLLQEAGRTAEAADILSEARANESPNLLIQVHQAQLMATTENHDFAFNAFRGLASQGVGVEAWLGAWRQARKIGKADEEIRYWDLLERTLKAPIEADEVYTLDMLASLYLEAGVKSDEALALAERNATVRKDEAARLLLEKARARVAAAAPARP